MQLLRNVIGVSIYSILGKAVGFLVPIAVAMILGVSLDVDHFFFAYAMLFSIAAVFNESIRGTLPSYIAKSPASYTIFVNSQTFALTSIALGVYFAVFLLLPHALSQTTRFSDESISAITTLYLLGGPLLIFDIWAALVSAVLDTHRIYWAPAISPAIRATIAIASLVVLREKSSSYSLMISFSFGEFLLLAFLIATSIRKLNFKLRFVADFELFKQYFSVGKYQLLTLALGYLDNIVDRSIGSFFGPGAISILEFSSVFKFVIWGALVTGLGTVITVEMAHRLNRRDSVEDVLRYARSLMAPVFFTGVGVGLALFLSRHMLTQLVYGHTLISKQDLREIATMAGIFFGTIPFVFLWLTSNCFLQTIRETKLLLKVTVFQFVVNLTADVILASTIGLKGIVVSTLVNNAFAALFLFFILRRWQTSRRAHC